MRRLLFIALFCFSYLSAAAFVFVIPSYNNAHRFKRNLDSIFAQNYPNYRIIYIDDASPDGTGQLVQDYIQELGNEAKMRLIRNTVRAGALANIYRAVWECAPHEVVVDLDGDDFLTHPNVLAQLSEIYADKNVWLTYGSWIRYPEDDYVIPPEITLEQIEQNAFRDLHGTGTTPLRTFYAELFHKIRKEDLLFEGSFYAVASDLAFMFPMLEMAGRHIKLTATLDYGYDVETSYNDFFLRQEEQKKIDAYIRQLPRYRPLVSLDGI